MGCSQEPEALARIGVVAGMTAEQVFDALRAAALAPSTHNTQPWRFRVAGGAFEVWADPSRRLPVVDPDDRQLRLACGAAVFNLRLAVLRAGRMPHVTMLPDPQHPLLLARVQVGATAVADPHTLALARAMADRRTNRRPFFPEPVPVLQRAALRRGAEIEHARLLLVEDPGQRRSLRELVHAAHRAQQADPAFHAELRTWTGHAGARRDGVPAALGGPRPEPQDQWVLRDFTGGAARERVQGKDFEPDPLIAVLFSFSDSPLDQLRCGQALQRVLLTATTEGLVSSFLSQPVEQPAQRRELRRLFGDHRWPQTVLRIGYGCPTGASPRRPVEETLIVDLPLG
ncbi:MAG: Acg family FMN-binding oxidoreductase [Pseudonocardiaceae bacterium]